MQNQQRLSVQNLRGVGPQLAEKLKKLGLETIQDLVFHLPLRYVDKTKISPIGSLQPFTSGLIEGVIKASDVVFGRRRSLLLGTRSIYRHNRKRNNEGPGCRTAGRTGNTHR